MRCLCLLLVFLLPCPLLGVTSLTVNNLTSGTITTPGDLAVRCNCATGGDRVVLAVIVDGDRDGVADAGEPVLDTTVVLDNGYTDENSSSGQVKFTHHLADQALSGPLVIRATDSGTGSVQHGYTMTYAALAQSVSGFVYSSSGSPLAGAPVNAEASNGSEYMTVTGADGSYQLSVPAGGVSVSVYGEAMGGQSVLPWDYAVMVGPGEARSGLNFRLVGHGDYTISGQVREGGKGIPGCEVWVRGEDYATLTDYQGNYSIGVPAGSFEVAAYPPNGWGSLQSVADVPPSAVLNFDLSKFTSYLAGRVLAGSTPIPGAEVETEGESLGAWTNTNANGWYQLWVQPGVDYYVGAGAPGYSMRYDDAWYGQANTHTADVLMSANAYTISGRVYHTPSGVGLDSMMDVWDNAGQWYGDWSEISDADGYYSVSVPASTWNVRPHPATGVNLDMQTVTTPPSAVRDFVSSELGSIPTLEGTVEPLSGLPSTTYTFSVTYQDAMYRVPEGVCAVVDGRPCLMEKADPGDSDPTDGIVYTYSTSSLAVGTHSFWFLCFGNGPTFFSSTTNAPTVGNALLDKPSLTPETGTNLTPFTASVRYTHLQNTAPTTKQFAYRLLGGSWVINTMSTADTGYSDGSTFTWTGHLPAGQIEYYFQFTVGSQTLRLPAAGSYPGPTVANVALSNAALNPSNGNATTPFVFSVTWTHSGGEMPPADTVKLWLRKVGAPSFTGYSLTAGAGDPVTGVTFSGTLSGLADGSYEYYFSYDSPTEDELRLPASSTLSGPTVDAGAPTVTISPTSGTFSGVVAITAAASDPDGIERVEFRIDGVLRATDTSAPYQYNWDSWPASQPDGQHTLRATAFDNTAHSAYAESTITTDNTTFDDVAKSASYWVYVEAVVREGITGGCSVTPPLFCPTSNITRGQMAVFLCRAMGLAPYNKDVPTFADVPKTSSQYSYIEAVYQAGITSGCSTSPMLYCPASPVTRGQMAVFLCRAASISPYNKDVPTFADVPKSSSQYAYIEAMYLQGVTGGCATSPLRYCPTSPVTRGQMAVFLCRAFGISTN